MKSVLVTALLAVSALLSQPVSAEVPESAWDVRPVLVGTTVPDITFVDQSGKPFSLKERAKDKPLILVVYRGLW
jgi:cytochrome oxidase Cu insertion factor (SCO1/SenC/PrrC family)